MTRDEILSMEAGREMDILILERVLGLKKETRFNYTAQAEKTGWAGTWAGKENYFIESRVPEISTNIAAAWQVVEKIAVEPLAFHLESSNVAGDVIWWALFWGDVPNSNEIDEFAAESKSAPLAICRAALLAVLDA